MNSSAAAWQDTIFVGSRDRNLYAIAADSGLRRWHVAAGDWVDSSPAVSGRTVYVGSHDRKLYALEAETGIVLWEYATDGRDRLLAGRLRRTSRCRQQRRQPLLL